MGNAIAATTLRPIHGMLVFRPLAERKEASIVNDQLDN